jgi:tRNA threonylcarbamoyladenosine biosynthesis protein TsaB
MRVVLGLDASTEAGSVALLEGSLLRGEIWIHSPQTHSQRILPAVDRLLKETRVSLEELEGICVGLGPGSFTGVRVALSTAKGLSLALGIPLAGISTLEALAHNASLWEGEICALVDARKGYVYGARYRSEEGSVRPLEPPAVRRLELWLEGFSDTVLFVGNGVHAYTGSIERILGGRARFAPPELLHPRASVIARLGLHRLQRGDADDLDALTPQYLRRSEAERKLRVT